MDRWEDQPEGRTHAHAVTVAQLCDSVILFECLPIKFNHDIAQQDMDEA